MNAEETTKKLKEVIGSEGVALLDDAVLEYAGGLLAESATENMEDIVEALAPFLVESGAVADETALRRVVERVTGRAEGSSDPLVLKHCLEKLDAPVQLSQTRRTDMSVWEEYLPKAENPTYVDEDAVRRAEAKLRERSEKRAAREAARVERQRQRAGVADHLSSASYSGLVHAGGLGGSGGGADADDGSDLGRDIHVDGVTLAYGKLTLLENATLTINWGRKYGLVGRNGCGKSTLLRHIAARDIRFSRRISVLHVEQEIEGDETTVLDAVLSADAERAALLAEEQHLLEVNPTSARLPELYKRLQDIDADSAELRVRMILRGLSFTEEMMARPTKSFSGGWRMRVALARALFCQPDLLLLDEPTNHLDFNAVIWLQRFLEAWKGTLVVVSHQRDFLNVVATDIIHLYNHQLTYYRGNYDNFERVANERIRQHKSEYEAQLTQRAHIQRFIDRFRCNANRAPQVQSRLKMLAKMPAVSAVVEEGAVVFAFPDPEPLPPPIMQFDEVSFAYTPGSPIIRKANFAVDTDSRIALVGANGSGKTTLLKLLVGDLEPTAGVVRRSGKVRVGLFTQHFVDQLDLKVSAVEYLQHQFPGLSVQEARAQLGRFGITGDTALQTLNTLSGGQKSRVVFAQIAHRKPHVLLLDEPSNHLDIETIEGLAQSLSAYQGGVLMVSHDQRLISMVCDEVWVIENHTVSRWKGDVASYRKHIESSMVFSL